MRYFFISLTLLILPAALSSHAAETNVPPEGFTALFNGQDLSGWYGLGTFDPAKWQAMSADEQAAAKKKTSEKLARHWHVENGELVNDGNGPYMTTDQNYGNFELLVDWKMVDPGADSGVYLRGIPQVQIWNPDNPAQKKHGADKGSGGLWNNGAGVAGRDPLLRADKPIGEWNTMRIKMVGAYVTVQLNGKTVVDHAPLKNYFQKGQPPIATGPIQLQTHGGEIRWRSVFIRELDSDDATVHVDEEGFMTLGKSNQGWSGPVTVNDEGHLMGRGWYTQRKFGDFILRFEFRLNEGSNSGIGIRSVENRDPAYEGMEIQVLDNSADKYANIKPWQAHGSIYGIAAAKRGHLKPVGEWNTQEIVAQGNRIKVTLNGIVINDVDIKEATRDGTLSGRKHPGLFNKDGYLAILDHGGDVKFRNFRIKPLD